MGTCTPKTSLNYQGNYPERYNQNGTLNYGTGGTASGSGACDNKDSTIRNYPSNGKGRVQQKNEKKTYEYLSSLPVPSPTAEMEEERMGIGMLGTHNVRPISVLPQHQNIRRTVM